MGLNINSSNTVYLPGSLKDVNYKVYIDSTQRGVLEFANGDAFKIVVSNIDEKTLNQFQLKDWEKIASKMVKMLAAQGMLNNFAGAEFTSKSIKNLSSENVTVLTGANTASEQQEMIHHLLERKREIEAPTNLSTPLVPQKKQYKKLEKKVDKGSSKCFKITALAAVCLASIAGIPFDDPAALVLKKVQSGMLNGIGNTFISEAEKTELEKIDDQFCSYFYASTEPMDCPVDAYNRLIIDAAIQKLLLEKFNSSGLTFNGSFFTLGKEMATLNPKTHIEVAVCGTPDQVRNNPEGRPLTPYPCWISPSPNDISRTECFLADIDNGDTGIGCGARIHFIDCSESQKDQARAYHEDYLNKASSIGKKLVSAANERVSKTKWSPSEWFLKKINGEVAEVTAGKFKDCVKYSDMGA